MEQTTMEQTLTNQIIIKIQKGQKPNLSEQSYITKELLKFFKPHQNHNYLYDQDEIKSAFLIAAYNALGRAKLDVGNPLAFCARRGYGATLDYYRAVSRQSLYYQCNDCNTIFSYTAKNAESGCPECKTKFANYITPKKLEKQKDIDMTTVKVGSFTSKEKTQSFAIDQSMAKFSVQSRFEQETETNDLINRLCASIKSSPLNKTEKKIAMIAITDKKPIKEVCKELSLFGKIANDIESTIKPFLQNLILRHS